MTRVSRIAGKDGVDCDGADVGARFEGVRGILVLIVDIVDNFITTTTVQNVVPWYLTHCHTVLYSNTLSTAVPEYVVQY